MRTSELKNTLYGKDNKNVVLTLKELQKMLYYRKLFKSCNVKKTLKLNNKVHISTGTHGTQDGTQDNGCVDNMLTLY